MNQLNASKIEIDYKKTEELIYSTNNYEKLNILAANIRRRINNDADYKHFVRLADNAEHKAKVIRVLDRCPSPINDSELEQIAFNNFVESSAVFDKVPSFRVIYYQLSKLGYAKTMARQVTKSVGGGNFKNMCKRGLVSLTSEMFIFKHGKSLVSDSVYAKVCSLFESDEPMPTALAA